MGTGVGNLFDEGDTSSTDYQLAVMNSDGAQVTAIPAPLGITTSLASIRWSLG
mgnify:CR=1 FL=1